MTFGGGNALSRVPIKVLRQKAPLPKHVKPSPDRVSASTPRKIHILLKLLINNSTSETHTVLIYIASIQYRQSPQQIPTALSAKQTQILTMESTPRINASLLQKFENQTVILVGKVLQVRGDNAVVDSNGTVNVQLGPVSYHLLFFCDDGSLRITNQNGSCVQGNYVEIVGKVQPDMTVRSLLATDWGQNVGK